MENKWISHYKKMVSGKLPNKPFYILKDDKVVQQGDGDIKLVSPGQQEVEQAKMTVKRKIKEFPFHTPTKKRRSSKKSKTHTKVKKVKKIGKASKGKKKLGKRKSKSKRSKKSVKKRPKKNVGKRIKKVKQRRKPQSSTRRLKVNTKAKLKYF